MEEKKSKYSAQIKYNKNNYRQFKMNLIPDFFDKFQQACFKNGTTPTTVIKAFMNDYIEKNK